MPRHESYKAWSVADFAKLRTWTSEGVPFTEQAGRFGRSTTSVRQKARAIGLRHPNATLETIARSGDDPTTTQEPEVSSPLSKEPLSVEEITALFKIDTDVWEAYHVTPNVWQMGAKHPETGEILKADLYQTKVRFRRKPGATLEEFGAELLADFRHRAKRRPRSSPSVIHFRGSEKFALEPDLFDIHIAKYAWKEETGDDYDSDITERIASAALSDLLAQVKGYPLARVILPIGNDFYHYDNPQGETTAGTTMDRDTRFQRMFRIGCNLAGWMIERCAEIAPTKVIVIPGNHDTTLAFTMGVVMEAQFAGDKRVTFDNSPAPRKYELFGKNLIGFAHGHEEKENDYAQVMAVERPQDWAASICREWHLGHFHTGRKRDPLTVHDKMGATIRRIRSLTAADAWHSRKAYLSNRSAEAFVWRESGGMRAHFVTLPIPDLLKGSQ